MWRISQLRRLAGEAERLGEVDEEDDPHFVAVVPGLVLIGIVEDQRPALLPVADAVGDADADLVGMVRHDQPEVETKHAVVGAAVRRQVLAGLEDREQGRGEARDLLQDAPGLGAGADRLFRFDAVGADQERLPIAVGADRTDIRGDLVEAGELVLARQQPVELGPDQSATRSRLRRPRERRRCRRPAGFRRANISGSCARPSRSPPGRGDRRSPADPWCRRDPRSSGPGAAHRRC